MLLQIIYNSSIGPAFLAINRIFKGADNNLLWFTLLIVKQYVQECNSKEFIIFLPV